MSEPAPQTVLVDHRDGVATITLNRPASLNSLSTELKEELIAALALVRDDTAVRAVVLTGAGRAFCVGQDLREHVERLTSGDPSPLSTVREHYNPIVLSIARMPKPVVAAVNGTAAGAGASFAFAADFRVAGESSRFAMAFTGVGLSVDSGASWTLQRLVGSARAVELLMLAEPVDATRARELGLVTTVVADDRVLDEARELAVRLASGPTVAYAGIKEAVEFAAGASLPEALEREAVLQERAGRTEDHRAATAAFVARESPTFTGR